MFISVQNMERKLKAISRKGAKDSEFLFDLESNVRTSVMMRTKRCFMNLRLLEKFCRRVIPIKDQNGLMLLSFYFASSRLCVK